MHVMETEEGRAVEDKGIKRRRGIRWEGRSIASGLMQAFLPPPPTPRATSLTTTWLQCAVDSFTHTASKISSGPKLHSRAAP